MVQTYGIGSDKDTRPGESGANPVVGGSLFAC
jgi:hypothetical protein